MRRRVVIRDSAPATMRLAHGWRLSGDVPEEWVRDFLRPAVCAVPQAMAHRLGTCRVWLLPRLDQPNASSRWIRTYTDLQIMLALDDVDAHDAALELLLCVGQALWETTAPVEREAYWKLLGAEIAAGIAGEIDEEALREKRALLGSRTSARSLRRFQRYALASFGGTVAEYVHSLWHDVTVREGPGHLPAAWLRKRLEMLARWFPPNRGYRLFPVQSKE